jgi:hypothetical protein
MNENGIPASEGVFDAVCVPHVRSYPLRRSVNLRARLTPQREREPHLAHMDSRSRGGSRVTSDRPTSSQPLSLLPVADFLTSLRSRVRSRLSRLQGRPRPFRTSRAKSSRSRVLSVSLTRSRAFTQRERATSHTTAQGTARPRVQRVFRGDTKPSFPKHPSSPALEAATHGLMRETIRDAPLTQRKTSPLRAPSI